MTLNNFRNYRTIDGQPFAEVDETTGIWPFKTTQIRLISKEKYSAFWMFVDTGRPRYYFGILEKLQATSIDQHMAEHEKALRLAIPYHKKHLAEDEKRAVERNAWLQTAWEAIDRLPE